MSDTQITQGQREDLGAAIQNQINQIDTDINSSGIWSMVLVAMKNNKEMLQQAFNKVIGNEPLSAEDVTKINNEIAQSKKDQMEKDNKITITKAIVIGLLSLSAILSIWFFIIRKKK